jgi:hypothetical protein
MFVCNSKQMILKQQKGKYLIFWLSFSDFASSSVYLFSSISLTDRDHRDNSNKCQAFALLGIFFPVASFLWTDFIAYYLYSMIVSRKVKTESEWKLLMLYFHIISWGVSALCILIVASFEHAGSADTEAGDNTGGWCWVAASSNSLIFWEIIGGKFVEWLSAFIILPYFYWITARTLMSLDQSWTQMTERNKKRSNKSTIWDSLSTTTLSLRFSLQTYFHPEASPSVDPLLGSNDEDDDDDDDDEFTEGDSEKRGSFLSSGRQQTTDTTNSHAHERIKFDEPTKVDECHNTPKFRKFYAKMVQSTFFSLLTALWLTYLPPPLPSLLIALIVRLLSLSYSFLRASGDQFGSSSTPPTRAVETPILLFTPQILGSKQCRRSLTHLKASSTLSSLSSSPLRT